MASKRSRLAASASDTALFAAAFDFVAEIKLARDTLKTEWHEHFVLVGELTLLLECSGRLQIPGVGVLARIFF